MTERLTGTDGLRGNRARRAAAKIGRQPLPAGPWIPACAGMTERLTGTDGLRGNRVSCVAPPPKSADNPFQQVPGFPHARE
jgi:hypothetical protein